MLITGEKYIFIPLNLSEEGFVIKDGERIFQIVSFRNKREELEEVGELKRTETGAEVFGHTAKHRE